MTQCDQLCYECNSVELSECNDPFDSTSSALSGYSVNCTGICQKIKTTILGGDVIARSCEDACVAGYIDVGIATVDTTCCSSELCNNASIISITLYLVIISVFLGVICI